MSILQTVQLESEASISQSIIIPFEFHDLSSLPKDSPEEDKPKETITINPITVRTWFELKPLLVSIDKDDFELIIQKKEASFDSDIQAVMSKYDELLFKIVCIGLNNKKEDMPDWYKEVLQDNCTWKDIYILLNAIFFRLNFNPFLNTITLCKSVSPLSEEEIIALQENKETWNRKATSCLLPFASNL